jgi:hypothetical protein
MLLRPAERTSAPCAKRRKFPPAGDEGALRIMIYIGAQ